MKDYYDLRYEETDGENHFVEETAYQEKRRAFVAASSENIVFLGKLDDFGDITEGKARDGVGASVIDGDPARFGVMERRAGERDVRNVARQLVNLARRNQVRAAAGDRLPRLVEVEQRRTERIDIT